MSKSYTQIKYKCRCKEPSGMECDKTSIFILQHDCSLDATTIYHKCHIEDVDSKYILYKLPRYISDQEIGALGRLIQEKPLNTEEIDKSFFVEYVKGIF